MEGDLVLWKWLNLQVQILMYYRITVIITQSTRGVG
jgi:hypothetical protein